MRLTLLFACLVACGKDDDTAVVSDTDADTDTDTEPDLEESGGADTGGPKSCGCAATGPHPGLTLIGLAAVVARRRRSTAAR